MTRERWLFTLWMIAAIAGALALSWGRHVYERRRRARWQRSMAPLSELTDAMLAAAAASSDAMNDATNAAAGVALRYAGGPICLACGLPRGPNDPVVSPSHIAGYATHEHDVQAAHVSRQIQLRSCARCSIVYTERM